MSDAFQPIVSAERLAQLIAHRACCGSEHDPANGKLHGCCVVCGVPWPCAYAGEPPSAPKTDGPDADEWMVSRADLDKAVTAYNDQSMQQADAQYVCMGKALESFGLTIEWETEPAVLLTGYNEFAPGDFVRHKKTGGVYKIETRCFIEKTMQPAYVYRAEDGKCFVRADIEMLDGRFERIKAATTNPPAIDSSPVVGVSELTRDQVERILERFLLVRDKGGQELVIGRTDAYNVAALCEHYLSTTAVSNRVLLEPEDKSQDDADARFLREGGTVAHTADPKLKPYCPATVDRVVTDDMVDRAAIAYNAAADDLDEVYCNDVFLRTALQAALSAQAATTDGRWYCCTSCLRVVRLPLATSIPARCQCTPTAFQLWPIKNPSALSANQGIRYWCNTHNRPCNVDRCDPKLGGITIPCRVVDLAKAGCELVTNGSTPPSTSEPC